MAVAEGWNFPSDSKSWKVIVEVSRGGDGGVGRRTLGTAWRGG